MLTWRLGKPRPAQARESISCWVAFKATQQIVLPPCSFPLLLERTFYRNRTRHGSSYFTPYTNSSMTKLTWVEIDVCTFCYNGHQRWSPKLRFDLANKQAVQHCFCCKQWMCKKCVDNAHDELGGSILAQFGFEICRTCIATVRRSNAMKPRLEKAVMEAVEYVREQMEVNIYSLMHEHSWAQSSKR